MAPADDAHKRRTTLYIDPATAEALADLTRWGEGKDQTAVISTAIRYMHRLEKRTRDENGRPNGSEVAILRPDGTPIIIVVL
jgi:hypothetical protein